MRHLTVKATLLLVIAASLMGCANLSHVVLDKETGGGKTHVYPVTADQAWEIAKAVFRWSGTDAIEEHRDQGYMLTSSGMNLISFGAVMGAWIESVGEKQARVTVVTKRRIATNIATTLTERTFHKRFERAVAMAQAGEPLPLTLPKEQAGG